MRGRVVVVTGSSRGIGKAAALAFAQEGARVLVTYNTDRRGADDVVAEIERLGSEGEVAPLELASKDSIVAATQVALTRWGRIDVLVNNAVLWGPRGPFDQPPFELLPSEEWTSTFRANAEGPYSTIQAVLPSMRERKWGRIVNISSGIAVDGLPGAGPYAAAKASLHGLTRTLSKELGPAGVLVNVVMPGFTLTERVLDLVPTTHREQVEQTSPIGRLLPPEEVAPIIVFLGSAANTAVTGEIVRASGGIS